jgi:TolB-like protein
VAVSLFDNETGDSRYDRAVQSLSDVVVDRLTNLGSSRIGVVGNASVLRVPRNRRDLKQIAADTGAGYVVLAQLQTKNGELSLLMHLIKLDDGTHLWTRRLSRPTGDALVGLDEDAAQMLERAAREYVLRDS